MIELNWYKIGYMNYDKYLTRKFICYSGKKITFSWSKRHYYNVLKLYALYIYPREKKTYNDYLKENF